LKVDDNRPIAPGETRVFAVNATAAAWETERLAGLANDPDNRFGGLLFFYDDSGNREIVNIAGPIIPKYI
jgi:methane/ammonia monooxygenase subunit B